MKKVTSKQNIAIIVLSVLLLVSIGFGATYSYFSGKSQNELAVGNVTMATLNVSIHGLNKENAQTSKFELHTEVGTVVPGQPLSNTALQVSNGSPVSTYMAVVYTLKIETDGPNSSEVNTSQIDAMDIKETSVGDGWRKELLTARDQKTKINILIYLGGEDGTGDGIFPAAASADSPNKSVVLDAECLKIPTTWDNKMQGATVSLTFTAYVIQSEAVFGEYPDILNEDVDTRTKAIANMFIDEFILDTTIAPVTPEPAEPIE